MSSKRKKQKNKRCKNPTCFDFATGRPAALSARQMSDRQKFCSKSCAGEYRRGRDTNGKNYIRIRSKKTCPACAGQIGFFENCERCDGTGQIVYRPYLHRWKMSQILGRELTETEVVHHIDYNPFNNDDDNLQLFATQSEHLAFHRANPFPPHRDIEKETADDYDFFMSKRAPDDYDRAFSVDAEYYEIPF